MGGGSGIVLSWEAVAGILAVLTLLGPCLIWVGRLTTRVDRAEKDIEKCLTSIEDLRRDLLEVVHGQLVKVEARDGC